MAANAPAPGTVGAVILPGWMPRDEAIQMLTSECVEPPFNQQQAADTWEEYQQRVEALPERPAPAPARQPLNRDERTQADNFRRRYRQAPNVLDVIKVDPSQLVAHQLLVITNRATEYAASMATPTAKLRYSLGSQAQRPANMNIRAEQDGLHFTLPHAEHSLNFDTVKGFEIQQWARHISTAEYDQRMLLWGGYHRAFAFMSTQNPDAIERSLVVVLTTDAALTLSPNSPKPAVRDMVRGLRPPLFGDFFDGRLCMNVRLRKKRYELLVQARILAIDDPT